MSWGSGGSGGRGQRPVAPDASDETALDPRILSPVSSRFPVGLDAAVQDERHEMNGRSEGITKARVACHDDGIHLHGTTVPASHTAARGSVTRVLRLRNDESQGFPPLMISRTADSRHAASAGIMSLSPSLLDSRVKADAEQRGGTSA